MFGSAIMIDQIAEAADRESKGISAHAEQQRGLHACTCIVCALCPGGAELRGHCLTPLTACN